MARRRHSGAQWLSAQSQKDGGNTGDIWKKMAVQPVVHVRRRVLVSVEGAAIKVKKESQSNEGGGEREHKSGHRGTVREAQTKRGEM